MLQATSRLLDVLSNDWPGSSPDLIVTGVTQPAEGVAAIEQNQVRFTPLPSFFGDVFFSNSIQDGNGLGSSARMAVVVADENNTSGDPQDLPLPDPSVMTTLSVTTPAGYTILQLPAGAIPGTVPGSITTYDMVYVEQLRPTVPLPTSNSAVRAFFIEFFIDAELQPHYVFAQPILLTLSYDPATVPDPTKLAFYFYDEQAGIWSNDGIAIIAVDTTNHTVVVSVAHLTEFALAVQAPTALEPVEEPLGPFRLYLPSINS